jgi:hypothetical protein
MSFKSKTSIEKLYTYWWAVWMTVLRLPESKFPENLTWLLKTSNMWVVFVGLILLLIIKRFIQKASNYINNATINIVIAFFFEAYSKNKEKTIWKIND